MNQSNQTEMEKLAKRINDFLDDQALYTAYFLFAVFFLSALIVFVVWLKS